MKEGSYLPDYVQRQKQSASPVRLPEDVGLSLRRSKVKSRFDMPFPPGNSSRKWDVDSSSKVSILEDYMLEDDDSQHKKKDSGKSSQWRAVTDAPKPPSESSHHPETNNIAPPAWQQPPPGVPPYAGYTQPPPGFNQPGYYPYDYQQYASYQNYYGYQEYGQNWGAQQQPPPPGLMLPDMTQPPPPAVPVPIPAPAVPVPAVKKSESPEPHKSRRYKEEEVKKEKDIKREDLSKDEGLLNQRDSYLRKASKLKRELDVLRQTKELMINEGETDSRIVKENNKLQGEIQNKLKAIDNVVMMLDKILGDKMKAAEKRKQEENTFKEEHKSSSSSSSSSDDEPEEVKQPPPPAEEPPEEVNLAFFDPEEHWCKFCGIFPATAKEYLNHLHTPEHKQRKDPSDIPWHVNNVEKERPIIRGAPSKRVPIRGLQFFIACQGWYCKLCSAWIGDLHCASMHLKSQRHMDNYEEFLSKNEDWEEEWSESRKRSMQEDDREKSPTSRLETIMRKQKGWGDTLKQPVVVKEEAPYEQRKIKEEEDASRSIRVQMRNKLAPEPARDPPMGPVLPPEMSTQKTFNPWSESQSNGKGQWTAATLQSNISESEKQLVKNLKDKLKKKDEEEEYYIKKDERRDKRKERRFRERSFDRSRSRSRSRNRSRGRERDYSRSRSRERRSRSRERRSRSRDRRRRRRSSSSRRGRSRSRSRSSERKHRKVETRQWVAPPSSPPPYIIRKTEDKEKWDKPKKKPAPNPVASLPKSKLPFIGRMPLLKHIAKKKQSDDKPNNSMTPEIRAPEDMEIDSGASDSEQAQPENTDAPDVEYAVNQELPHQEEEEFPAAAKPASGIPLPQDFQDALCILFPDDEYEHQAQAPPAEADEAAQAPPPPTIPSRPRDCGISAEELLMLGIEPEDMVAQDLSKF